MTLGVPEVQPDVRFAKTKVSNSSKNKKVLFNVGLYNNQKTCGESLKFQCNELKCEGYSALQRKNNTEEEHIVQEQ
jgi:hypothetical protein